MDALILAAGLGTRLRQLSTSKPLTPVAGKSLLEIGARQAADAGVSRVVVVTGHQADRVEAALPEISQRAGVPVVACRVEDSLRPNGYSVMAGAALIGGNYLLMMADHIFSGDILRELACQSTMDRGVTLAIDRRIDSPLIDPHDATWVSTAPDGMIRSIGKAIANYDAIDCGAFLATPELAQAIAKAVAAGRPGSLSDGMQWLADTGRAATMDIGDRWWIDVDDPRAHALAETSIGEELPEIFEKPTLLTAARDIQRARLA